MRALIIDDEAVAVAALRRRVDWPCCGIDEVFTASSMKQAVALMQKQAVDLMLSDIEMPGGSGLELFEWVRAYRPNTACIYITCHAEYDYMREAMQLGSMDYILKPVDYAELTGILKSAVARLRLHQKASAADRALLRRFTGESAEAAADGAVAAAKRYIADNISENISVSDIAAAAHLNPQYFMRLFKKETGLSVLSFMTAERVSLAERLLVQTELPIQRIAICVGYDNFSYFDRIFKRSTGQSPALWRKSHKCANIDAESLQKPDSVT